MCHNERCARLLIEQEILLLLYLYPKDEKFGLDFLSEIGETRFERATPSSQARCAKPDCATPRLNFLQASPTKGYSPY